MQGMPQLDITTYSSQIFWLVVSFGVLYFFVSRFFLPKVKGIFVDRDNLLNSLIVKIKQIKNEIELKRAKNDEVIQSAKFTAHAIVDEASDIVSRIKSDSLMEFSHQLEKIHRENRDLITRFKSESKNEMKRVVFNIAMKYYGVIFISNFTDKTVDFSMIRQFITKEIEKNIVK